MAANNPRKFEEKIHIHKTRQAAETKEFEKIMEEMSQLSAKSHHNQRQNIRGRYGGSLPDFNLAQSQSMRNENLNDLAVRHTMDIQPPIKDRPYHPSSRNRLVTNRRHHMETGAPYHHFSPYLSPPQIDPNWRRTSSDSSIYHNLTNPNNGGRKMSTSPDSTREVGSYLAPKDSELEEMKLMPNSGQQQQSFIYPSTNNGSLPDLSNLHIPSPLSVSIDQDEPQYNPNFSAANSNAFLNRQSRRNTTGSSCKRQVYRHHPASQLDHLQMPGYMFQQSPSNTSDPTSPTVAPMYQAPMSPLANGPGYLQYPGQITSGSLQQQLEQMATITEGQYKPINVANGQMGQGAPPQSPNTFLNMLTQNPAAMENVRQRFQDVFGNVENSEVDLPVNNSLAADLGNAIGGFDGLRGYPSFDVNTGDFPPGLSLAPLDIQDIDILSGQTGDAKPEVEEQLRREGQQQLMR